MKNWKSLQEFFEYLNKESEYVVLRNYEEFINGNFSVDHPDIDLLCRDAQLLLSKIGSKSRCENFEDNKIHRLILINGFEVMLDIREVGDGYYDTCWENEMLSNRVLLNNYCYVLNDTNYFYTLLYHAIVQKRSLSDDYEKRLKHMAAKLNISLSEPLSTKELEVYMRKKHYKYTYPEDLGVITNFVNIDKNLIKRSFRGMFRRNIRDLKIKIRHILHF